MFNDLISVIVPVYNAQDYLNRCVDSILGQTYKKIEIILVDDGSTDNSGAICDSYLTKDTRVQVYHKKNEGPAVARNCGIEYAQGEYLTFVDSDDWIESQMYECLICLSKEHNTAITGCASMTDYENGISKNSYEGRTDNLLTGENCILDILYQTKFAWGAVHNKLYRRSLFDDIRFPNVYNLEDYMVSCCLYNKIDKIWFCEKPMYHYSYRNNSLSKGSFSEKKLLAIDVAESIRSYFIADRASDVIIGGANSFVFRIYANIMFEVYKNKPENWKEMIKKHKVNAIKAIVCFLQNSRKQKGDIKRLIKLFIVLICAK